jgi:hypothetical protein
MATKEQKIQYLIIFPDKSDTYVFEDLESANLCWKEFVQENKHPRMRKRAIEV